MDTAKLVGQKKQIIDFLDARGPQGVLNWEFPSVIKSIRFGARIEELRKHGYTISVQRVRGSIYRYTLVAYPERYQEKPITEGARQLAAW